MFERDPFTDMVIHHRQRHGRRQVPAGLPKGPQDSDDPTSNSWRDRPAERFLLLPAKKLFTLGVGHVRRRGLEPGSRADVPADVTNVTVTDLNESEWRVLIALKREFAPEELVPDLWAARREAGVLEDFLAKAQDLERRNIIGRFRPS
jgi:hypothetical protein